MADNNDSTTDEKDLLSIALNNRVENFVQVELQRRQFGNRYTRTPQPGEPVGDYQTIGLGDYQVDKPVWAVVRSVNEYSSDTTLIGSALSLFEPDKSGKDNSWNAPKNNFTHNYDVGQNEYVSEYGSGGSYRPKPGIRNISVNTLGNGLYSEITINFKCFTKLQLNKLSKHYMDIGHEFLIMFGYGSIGGDTSDRRKIVNLINPETDESLLKESGKASIESEVAAYSQGTMYAKIGRVQSFDINFSGDDATFDVTTTFVTEGSLKNYKFQDDTKRTSSVRELLTKPEPPTNEKKEDTTYEKYSQFIEKLRGYNSNIDFNFILPTQESLYSIGQELESEFTELMVYQRSDEDDAEDLSGQPTTESTGGTERQRVEDREPLPGFERVTAEQQQKLVKIIEEENSDKALTANECREAFNDGLGELNLNFPISVNGKEQLAFGIKNDKGKGNRKVDQSYIPWAVCEWILNNGVHVKKEDGSLEVVIQRYSKYLPPRKVFFVPMKEEVIEVNEPAPEGSPQETSVVINQTVFSDDIDKMEVVSEVQGSHENYIRTLQLPHAQGSGVGGEMSGSKKLPTMGLLKSLKNQLADTIQGGKMASNVVDVPEYVFSIDPGVCIITDTIPTNGIVDPKIPFKMHELNEKYKFYIKENSTKGYIRNILINADYFYEKLIKNQEDVDMFYGLDELVMEIFTDVSNALGGVIGFKTKVGDDGELMVMDKEVNQKVYTKTELETAKDDYYEIDFSVNGTSEDKGVFRIYENIFPLNNFGQDSIVRDLSYSMDLDGDISNHFFWNKSSGTAKPPENFHQELYKKKQEQNGYIANQQDYDKEKLEKEIKALEDEINKNASTAQTYLDEYLLSAARTYANMVPSKNGEVNFSLAKRVLNTKLKKIITSSELSQRKLVKPPFNVPTLPLQVEVTIDGIAGIKIFDSFYLSYLPPMYDDGFFKVIGITHSVEGTDWFTKLNLLYIPSDYKIGDN